MDQLGQLYIEAWMLGQPRKRVAFYHNAKKNKKIILILLGAIISSMAAYCFFLMSWTVWAIASAGIALLLALCLHLTKTDYDRMSVEEKIDDMKRTAVANVSNFQVRAGLRSEQLPMALERIEDIYYALREKRERFSDRAFQVLVVGIAAQSVIAIIQQRDPATAMVFAVVAVLLIAVAANATSLWDFVDLFRSSDLGRVQAATTQLRLVIAGMEGGDDGIFCS